MPRTRRSGAVPGTWSGSSSPAAVSAATATPRAAPTGSAPPAPDTADNGEPSAARDAARPPARRPVGRALLHRVVVAVELAGGARVELQRLDRRVARLAEAGQDLEQLVLPDIDRH